MATWDSPALGIASRAAASPARCASAGRTYSVNVIVEHKNGKVELKPLFLVCQPNHLVKIVDWKGDSYDDLDDFRAHNHVFSDDDKINVPRTFPSVDATESPAFGPAVSGHTGTSTARWWLTAGLVLMLITGGLGSVWIFARHRRRL
ncbi:hypothetical protein [Actinomadura sp. 9N215]|uniref:hypothetical protein n=1 Tax=Actinomadura sp. 9N215 TaxID=3375150 RepID=UPI00379747A8